MLFRSAGGDLREGLVDAGVVAAGDLDGEGGAGEGGAGGFAHVNVDGKEAEVGEWEPVEDGGDGRWEDVEWE